MLGGTLFHTSIRQGLVLIAVGLFAASCAPAQTAAPSANNAAPAAQATVALAPTAVPQNSSPTSIPANSSSSDNTIRLVAVPGKSQADYRVREQLANVSLPSDAVGKTNAISGAIVGKADGSIVSSDSKFVVDLSTLQSDRSQRDNFLKRSVLQTDKYPDAVFVPTKVEGLPLTMPPASNVSFKLTGDLTIRDVTKPVTWDVTCQSQDSQGTCHATTSFTFEDFNLTQPRVSVVLSIQDHITLETDVDLQPANG
jgi:polyisoprenoid-binding protein YceI